SQQLTSALYESAITTGTNTALQSAINGDSFSEALKNQVVNTVVMAGAKLGANAIGDSYHTDEIGKATQLTLHAALGATVNLLTGNDALSGAISGVVGELAGEVFQDMGYNKTDGSNLAGLVSGLSSIIVSKAEGSDLSEISDNAYSGQRIGVNATLNNAYYAKRAMEGSSWSDKFSDNDTLDKLNLEYSHEQIFMDDTGENIGYFGDGLFSGGEIRSDKDYLLSTYVRTGDDNYDDDIMRQAIKNVDTTQYLGKYNIITNNCQNYADSVRSEYYKIVRQQNQ
ncbi:MAG TPA: DUF637 domain-containing protein, partial [Rickettsiales bacterium]|nr:DUF637 domain-containing protein [Rickettsiales bacterium]